MSPIRKSDDYRAQEISSWQDYIDEEIEKLAAQGELQNLPGQGKPITIWKTDVNPEYDLAFSRLKNAGVMPLWMELDQEIGRLTGELWSRLDRVEARLRDQMRALVDPPIADENAADGVWNRMRTWFRQDFSEPPMAPLSITTVIGERERERRRFLELATELDKKISTFHDALPKGGEHLQRLRWLPDRAARVFDERIRLTDWWEELGHGRLDG